jgi:hypothetical protein
MKANLNLLVNLSKDALYYQLGRLEADGSGVKPYQVVWNVLPDNWKGEHPVRPFFVATHPDESVPRLLESIRDDELTVWWVEGFTKQ